MTNEYQPDRAHHEPEQDVDPLLDAEASDDPGIEAAATTEGLELPAAPGDDEEQEEPEAPELPAKLERLQKILAQAGVASRRHAEELIKEGRVQVNGKVVAELGSKADPLKDHIRVDGKIIHGAERPRYFMLNKPKGYVTTVSDPEGRPTVITFFEKMRERLYPVGRLDYQSEGLLLMTNDGDLANKLTRAASGVEKTYLVKVSGRPTNEELERLRSGVGIEQGQPGSRRVQTAPARIRQVRQGENPWFEVVLIEGRNRELRKMFGEIGHHVEKIRRVGYGPLVLDLEPGKVRELDAVEIAALRSAAEGKSPAGLRTKSGRVDADRPSSRRAETKRTETKRPERSRPRQDSPRTDWRQRRSPEERKSGSGSSNKIPQRRFQGEKGPFQDRPRWKNRQDEREPRRDRTESSGRRSFGQDRPPRRNDGGSDRFSRFPPRGPRSGTPVNRDNSRGPVSGGRTENQSRSRPGGGIKHDFDRPRASRRESRPEHGSKGRSGMGSRASQPRQNPRGERNERAFRPGPPRKQAGPRRRRP